MTEQSEQGFCSAYGFNDYRRHCCLDVFELDPERDRPLAECLQKAVIEPRLDAIVDDFYNHLLAFDVYKQFLADDALLSRLKTSQRNYLRQFGIDFDSETYFAGRLQVGVAHKRVGLPVALYQSAYRKLMQIIIDSIPVDIDQHGVSRDKLSAFIIRMMAFDMSLAIETYHSELVQELHQSLDSLRTEGEELRGMVSIDALTGVFSRSHILGLFERGINVARQQGKVLSLAMVDLDNFKKINDTHGHVVGDQVLGQVGKKMQQMLRDSDFVGRYGGEEFMIVLCNTAIKDAKRVIERLRKSIADTQLYLDNGMQLSITLSAGVTELRDEDSQITITHRADEALYEAKRSGRNRIIVS